IMPLLLLFGLFAAAMAEGDWQPLLPESSIAYTSYSSPERGHLKIVNRKPVHFTPNKYAESASTAEDSCSVYKVSMNQEVFYQYLAYDKDVPDLKEFTLCMWNKFHNHSDDHPLFSYAGSELFQHGRTRANLLQAELPLEAEHLVGQVIKGGGVAITGQEQSVLFSKDNIQQSIKRSPGLLGEVTMVQLYHVALTAGKAHKDHKHHHVHHFKHDGSPVDSSTEPETEPPAPQATPLGNGNFLIGGQLQRPSNLNLVPAPQQMIPIQLSNGLQLQQEYVNGQLGNRIISEQLLNSVQPDYTGGSVSLPQISIVPTAGQPTYSSRPIRPSKTTTVLLSGSLFNPANVQYIDDTHNRGLVALSDGSIVDEALLSPDPIDEENEDAAFQESLLNGLAGVVGNLPVQNVQKETADEREPAEAEVKAVMQVCSGCAHEPFKRALVLSWRTTPKKLYSGAHYYKGLPLCRAF
ncbi:Neuronal pentraxin-2, partial [Operophtera brumata]